jgi:hypothetical protein
LPEISSTDLFSIGARLVGVTFIWTAIIKAIAPQTFALHLSRLGWIPDSVINPAVTAAAGLEAALGIALLTMMAPGLVLPLTLVLLVVLSAVSWWGVKSGKASDCGCYGGLIQPSIGQSLGLNALYFSLVALAWFGGERSIAPALWQVVLVIAGGAATAGFAHAARKALATKGEPLVDLNPLKVGKRWKHRWAGNATAGMEGEYLVAYLGPKCPHCGTFVRIANAMIQSPALPRVVGVTAASKADLQTFVEEKQIRFPVKTISESLMMRLAYAVPTVALVKDGVIEAHWSGSMPPDFARRFTRAFFPDAVPQSQPATA